MVKSKATTSSVLRQPTMDSDWGHSEELEVVGEAGEGAVGEQVEARGGPSLPFR
jgi:hypothetical protein